MYLNINPNFGWLPDFGYKSRFIYAVQQSSRDEKLNSYIAKNVLKITFMNNLCSINLVKPLNVCARVSNIALSPKALIDLLWLDVR